MYILIQLAIALFAGLMVSRLTRVMKLPAVTAYLVAGILVGPYCLGQLGLPGIGFAQHQQVLDLSIFSEVALGFIAFAIGNEFRLKQLRRIGRQATVIAIVQAIAATLFVDLALFGLHLLLGEEKLPLSMVLMLGAIATATAPAATLMVVQQYKAKGEVTEMLLPVVALDDAVGLVVFAVSYGVAKALSHGAVNLLSVLVEPLVEIGASVLLGVLVGLVFTWVERLFHSRSKRLTVSITFVLLAVALSMMEFTVGGVHVSFSSLLVCMVLGTVFCNLCDVSEELMARVDRWTAPLFVLFFVLSGAELELSILTQGVVVGAGVVYIIARSAGKYLGARFSARLTHCSPNIHKYLGITLLPQAGVALGMSLKALQFGPEGEIVRNITLFSVLIYELVGPILTKLALMKAGEIRPEGATNARAAAKDLQQNNG